MGPKSICLAKICCIYVPAAAQQQEAPPFRPKVLKVSQNAELGGFELPLSHPEYSPKAVSEHYYYCLFALPAYKSYPVYAPGRAKRHSRGLQ